MRQEDRMKRRWFVLAALGLTAATLVGSAQPTTLTFWSWRVEDKAFYDDIAKQFEQKNGIKIEFEPYKNAEYPTILSSALAAGTGPDIIHTRAYGGLAQLADAGYLMPVDAKMIPALRGFSKTLMSAARGFTSQTQNQVYGVPFATQTLGIYYNKALLKKAGITALPESWDEFKQTLQKVRAAGILPLGNGAKDAPIVEQMFGVVGPMFYGATGFFNAVVRGDKKFTDPLFVRAIRETAALKDFFPPNFMGIGEDEGRALFFNEQAAFILAGSWNIGYFKAQNPKLDMGFMAAPPLQKGGLKYVSTFADGNYSINAKTKNKDAAVKFLNFLASKDFGQQFTDALAQASAVPGVSAKDPILQDVLELRAKHGTPYIMLVGFRYKTPTGSELLRNGIQRLMQGQGSAQQVAEDVQRGLATWYEPFKR
jgi:raffinose/stachyose/melibiose transport system substrate-binding protein